MAGNQELFQGMQMFQQGVASLVSQRSIAQANDAVDQIRNSEMQDAEKAAQIKQVAQNLSLRMVGLGMPAGQVEHMYNVLSPKPPTMANSLEASIYGTPDQTQKALDYENRQQQNKLEQLRAANTFKIEKGNVKETKDALNTFRDKVAKKDLDGLTEMQAIPELLASGNNLGYVQALKTLIKKNDPRISDQDFALASPNTDIANKMKRAYSQLVEDKPLTEDTTVVQQVADIIRSKAENAIKQKAQGYARTRAKMVGMTPEELHDAILTESLPGYTPMDSTSPAGPGSLPTAPSVSSGLGNALNYFKPVK
jgi:sulfite reductase alpha subunit-like flavoprotein